MKMEDLDLILRYAAGTGSPQVICNGAVFRWILNFSQKSATYLHCINKSKTSLGALEVARSIRFWPCKHEDLISDPRNYLTEVGCGSVLL